MPLRLDILVLIRVHFPIYLSAKMATNKATHYDKFVQIDSFSEKVFI